jgi:hypothetical protein
MMSSSPLRLWKRKRRLGKREKSKKRSAGYRCAEGLTCNTETKLNITHLLIHANLFFGITFSTLTSHLGNARNREREMEGGRERERESEREMERERERERVYWG